MKNYAFQIDAIKTLQNKIANRIAIAAHINCNISKFLSDLLVFAPNKRTNQTTKFTPGIHDKKLKTNHPPTDTSCC